LKEGEILWGENIANKWCKVVESGGEG